MPFSFLNPFFLAAALAVGVPLWLHLRRRQERRVLRFSAVRFLHDQPRPRRSPLRLENLLLFLLRAAAVVLLAAAFAWPYVRPTVAAGVAEARLYILDNTLSQQANGKFEASRARILREVRRAPDSVQVGVLELTSAPKLVAALGESRDVAAGKVESLSPSHQRGSYLAAFRLAASLLEKTPVPRRRVVLVSDNQANQWMETTNALALLAGTEVEVVPSDARTLRNVYLHGPHARRVFKGDKSFISLTVQLSHCGEPGATRVLVKANGQTVLSRSVDLAGQPRGTQAIHAEWESPADSPVEGQALAETAGDSLAADDTVFFAVPKLSEGKVAVLAHSPYLRMALSPEVMRGRWAAQPLEPGSGLDASRRQPEGDVLCVESSYFASPEARDLVRAYLGAGRGVLLFVNKTSPAIKGYLHELGFEADRRAQTSNAEPEGVQFMVPNHPVFQPFASGEYGGLLDLAFSSYSRFKCPDATPLLFSASGGVLLFEAKRGPGRLYLAAFGMDREHTSWPVHPTFIPFLDLLLQSCRGPDGGERSAFEPGEFANLPADGGPGQFALKQGAAVIEQIHASGGRARFRLPDKPGLYTLGRGAPGETATLAVNCPAKESELVFSPAGEVPPKWRVAGSRPRGSPAAMPPPAGSEVFAQRIWWWLLLGALAALLIEVPAAGRKEATP